ncbi:MAG: nuclease A inhibitor family protein [Phormidesmis sp.]
MSDSQDLKAQLEAICEDLWWSSEADYPVEVVWQPATAIATSADHSIEEQIYQWVDQKEPRQKQRAIEISSLEDIFGQATTPKSWHTAEDKVQLSKLHALKSLLTSALNSPQVYRCGEIEIAAYALGVAFDGTLAGVRTTLVET